MSRQSGVLALVALPHQVAPALMQSPHNPPTLMTSEVSASTDHRCMNLGVESTSIWGAFIPHQGELAFTSHLHVGPGCIPVCQSSPPAQAETDKILLQFGYEVPPESSCAESLVP